ncbi:ethanolamine ammonia-lyase subunit EutC [Brevibacillus sp. SYP-B805]|uniref:ethanolamine ammonia-lyase subunit EutC n=1 Tax=Brevibacillus sp. SYP-B805 TaxID=1578199 RepID=UPI001F4991B3|nr:ethanolamine ammonia-lyase subunit EutC [Brevibacillus sp. SYP-B805]
MVDHPKNARVIEAAQAITPARIGIGRAGTRMKTHSLLRFRIDHAAAQDAVLRGVSDEFIHRLGLPILHTQADTLEKYLMDLDAGRKLDDASVEWIRNNCPTGKQVQIIVSDGLSSSAVEANIPDLLPALIQGLEMNHITYGKPVFIKRSRVWVQDQVAQLVDCDVVISLIGERPGLATAESLSAYMVYRPTPQTVEADRTVVSNIHRGGTPPIEAGAYLAELIKDILAFKASGVKFAASRG